MCQRLISLLVWTNLRRISPENTKVILKCLKKHFHFLFGWQSLGLGSIILHFLLYCLPDGWMLVYVCKHGLDNQHCIMYTCQAYCILTFPCSMLFGSSLRNDMLFGLRLCHRPFLVIDHRCIAIDDDRIIGSQ